MAKGTIKQITTPPGGTALEGLLAFLADKDAYQKRWDDMERLRDECNERLKGIDDLKQIERLKLEAETKLKNAKDEADLIRSTATNNAEKAMAEAAEREKSIGEREQICEQREGQLAEQLGKAGEELQRREDAVGEREAKCERRERALTKLHAQTEAVKAELDSRLAKVRAVMGEATGGEAGAEKQQ